jgi:hypothetical protein
VDEGRKPNGQFGPGNPGGGGPKGSRNAHWHKLLHDSTTDDEFIAAWQVVKDAVKAGDMKAAVIFFERMLGKAVQSVELTGADGEALVVTFKKSAE